MSAADVRAAFLDFGRESIVPSDAALPHPGLGAVYVRSQHKWVPTTWSYILPDGSGYLTWDFGYGEKQQPFTSRLHLFDTAGARERVLPTGEAWMPLDYSFEGVYMAPGHLGTEGIEAGLWLLNVNTNKRRQLIASAYWPYVTGGAAWGGDVAPGVAPPPAGIWAFNRLLGLNLSTGAPVSWLVTPGARIDLFGVDRSGHPLVVVSNQQSTELRLVTSPGQWRSFEHPPDVGAGQPATPSAHRITDASGIWAQARDAIYLFDAEHGLRLVATGPNIALGGDCR